MPRPAAGSWVMALALAAATAAAAAAPRPAPPHAPAPVPAGPARADEPPPPADDRGCDILSYDLDLVIEPAARWLSGTAAVGYAALAADLDSLRLDLVPDLRVDRVDRAGASVPYVHEGASLRILLDPPPAAGRPDTVTIRWHGEPPPHGPFGAGLMFRTHDAGTREDRSDDVPVVFNVSQPWSAHAWWPCKDLPADKALLSLAVTVPDTLAVMANGTLLDVAPAGPGKRRWAWREAWPIAPYLVSVAVSDYVGWDEPCRPPVGGPVPLQYRVFPPDSAAAAFDFGRTCAMVELMSELAGPWPFPGEKYAQAEIKWVGAMEHQTATSFSQFLLTGDRRWEGFVVHELAHQWFGDSLTPATWADIWLNEGFARYCEGLWLERTGGPRAYRDFLQAIGPRRHEDLFTEQGLLGDPDPILPNLLVYDKGAWLLHSLRLLIGDEAFFAFLLDYATDPGLVRGTVTTADARAAAERAAGRDLGAFFAGWLESSTVAEIAASWSAAPVPGGARVDLTLEQRQDPVFPVALPVEIVTAAGTLRRTALLEARRATFRYDAALPVVDVRVDPDSLALIRRAGTPPPPPLAVSGPRPNPVGPAGARFDVTAALAGPVTVGVHDARGRRLATHALGPLSAGETTTWTWLPLAADDRPLPSGVFWLEFRSPHGRAVRKTVVLH